MQTFSTSIKFWKSLANNTTPVLKILVQIFVARHLAILNKDTNQLVYWMCLHLCSENYDTRRQTNFCADKIQPSDKAICYPSAF